MSEQFQNKFRISSARLKDWDYGRNADYFITICTRNKEHFFGSISNGDMYLNKSGKIAERYWTEIPNQFPFVEPGNFIVMPNHIHGILMINKNIDGMVVATDGLGRDAINRVSTDGTTNTPGGITGNKNPMFHDNISRIIRWYKGRCTFDIHKINPDFEWQSRFHDHIIRDYDSFDRIQDYIFNNPRNWQDDSFYK